MPTELTKKTSFSSTESESNRSRDSSTTGLELKPLVFEGEGGDQYDATTATSTLPETFSDNDDDDGVCSPTTTTHHSEFGVGSSSPLQVAVNIFISFVGSGMLGMPYAFKQSGYFLGVMTLFVMSTLNVYAMLLLVKTRQKLEARGNSNIFGYGDVGRIVSGRKGENFVNICLVISQVGFATAYIIFIAANLNQIYGINRAYVCFGCVPFLALLVQIQDMKHLSPFSLVADVSNLAGLSAVMLQDYLSYRNSHETVIAFNYANVLYVASVSLYALEGVGLVLPLESSCADKEWFPSLLKKTIFGITSLMAVFGCCGYFAFGSETEAPITLNLNGDFATIVKFALCIALYLTFPVMLFPVNEVMEDFALGAGRSRPNRPFRSTVVFLSCLVAYLVPDFGKFLGLVGASICSILGLILPAYFHLLVFDRSEMTLWQWFMDLFLIIFGLAFGIIGTYDSFVSLLEG